ncbi:MAG TPA: hypothetical protein VMU28_04860 [Terriglobales bacterium]|nr:hypothetical protein [Terriglobales bacterium]
MSVRSEITSHAALETVTLELGGARWQLRSFVDGLRIDIDGRTAEFVSRCELEPDVAIDVFWTESLNGSGTPLFDAGLWRAYEAGDGVQFDFFTHLLGPEAYKRAIFNKDFSAGQILLNRAVLGKLDSYYPFEYPLDELASMHRLGRGRGVELHSCGLATADQRGYLFVGHSGAGKSTLGKQWVNHRRATILSDDRVVVTGGDDGFRIHGTPWHGEAGLARNASAELRAIFLIRHGQRNQTLSLAPSKSAAELLTRSFVPWYCAEALDFTLSFLDQLSGEVPVYVFDCLPDVSAVEYLERTHAI